MPPLLLIAAVESETTLLQRLLTGAATHECAQRHALSGSLCGQEVVLLCSGVGKTNAAATVAVALERYAPTAVINVGSAGAYADSTLEVGDRVLAREEVMADEGVDCDDSFLDFEDLGFPSVSRPQPRFNRFPAPVRLVEQAQLPLTEVAAALGVTLHVGSSLTVSSCSGTQARGNVLAQRWGGCCENMEGAAVAQVCSAWGTPWLEVRGISNMVANRDLSTWELKRAAENAQHAVRKLVDSFQPEEWPC